MAVGLRDRFGGFVTTRPSHASVVVGAILLLGAVERIVLIASYKPAILNYPDTYTYVIGAAGSIFQPHPLRPAGYAGMLAVLDVLGGLSLTIWTQHLMGLATALLAYVLFRKLGAPWAIAAIPAAAYAWTPDQLYFEHSLLSETPFAFLVIAGLLVGANALQSPPSRLAPAAWAGLAGVIFGASATARAAGLFAVPVVALAFLVWPPQQTRRRVVSALAVIGGTALVVIAYGVAQQAQVAYFGLSELGGWALYGRVAPFADCRRFTPPEETEGLCETSDWRERSGPDFYVWNNASPAWREFSAPPYNADKVGSFARAAILAQPTLYARAVAKDLVRYVDEGYGYDRPDSGAGAWRYAIDLRGPSEEASNLSALRQLYGPHRVEVGRAVAFLANLQEIVRVRGFVVLLSVVGIAGGVVAGRRRSLAALLLTGGTAIALVAGPTATTQYNFRYAVPVLPLLLGAGAIGIWFIVASLLEAVSKRRSSPALDPHDRSVEQSSRHLNALACDDTRPETPALKSSKRRAIARDACARSGQFRASAKGCGG